MQDLTQIRLKDLWKEVKSEDEISAPTNDFFILPINTLPLA